MTTLNFKTVDEELKNAQAIIITFPAQPSFDALAAALALYLSLKEAGRRVTLASALMPNVGQAVLVGINKIRQELEGQNLIISFDYLEDSIEKVSYNIEGRKFNLVVQTKSGLPTLDPKSVTYNQSGASGDLIISVGAKTLNDLGEIYQKNQDLFNQKPMINIDNQAENRGFGKINLIDSRTLSEMILKLIMINKLPLDVDVAKNLFLGIREATENFGKGTVTAETFEAAAICLKNGVKIEEEKREEKRGEKEVPPDWLAPKIFQSSAKV